MESVFEWLGSMNKLLIEKYPVAGTVLAVLGVLVVVAQVVVVITPTKKDDEKLQELMGKSWFKGLFEFLKSFAPFQKGKEGLEKSSETTK